MKKIEMLVCLALALLSVSAWAVTIREITNDGASQKAIVTPDRGLTVGERLTFLIAWKTIPVGSAIATVEELTRYNGHEVYKVVVVAKTNDFLSMLFKIEDTFISYIDKDKLIPRRYESIQREGRYRKHLVVDYDFDSGTATYDNLQDGSRNIRKINNILYDPVSASYMFRTMPLSIGDEVRATVNLNQNDYDIVADIDKMVNIELKKLGSYECFLVKPHVMFEGNLQKRAKSWGYISSDKKRLIVYLAVNVLEIPWIGEVTATLVEVVN